EEPRPSSFTSEITYNGITPDQIALRRARRILLDETPVASPDVGTFSAQRMNEDMLEHYVSGEAGGHAVTGSPIPGIVRGGNEPAVTVQVIRMVCALFLIVTNTVERVTRLEIQPVPGGVSVNFVGLRARQYSNVEPTVLTVTGVCPVA
ncbi:MAG: hypothetical protein M3Z85_18280, partial [Acidobacteriota bacterium]|nr:hypothetical protein [Acidobacteriota bacterium]